MVWKKAFLKEGAQHRPIMEKQSPRLLYLSNTPLLVSSLSVRREKKEKRKRKQTYCTKKENKQLCQCFIQPEAQIDRITVI